MGIVRTVCGDIEATDLGVTYTHEHLLSEPPVAVVDSDLRMDSEEAAIRELSHFRTAGGQAIVDMSSQDYGRNAVGLRRVSETTGAHIVCATGWHKERFSGPWMADRSVNNLADEMIRDIEEGIDGTEIRAGVIKVGSSLNMITLAEEKAFRAAARAQRETGVPISMETEAGTMGLEQVALLRCEGANVEPMIIGHVDHNLDLGYHRALAGTGVTLGYDQLGKEKYAPDSLRIRCILTLLEEGFGDQIVISGDQARRSSWPSYGGYGGPGLTYILWRFVPWLAADGLDTREIEQLLVRTPARLLEMKR